MAAMDLPVPALGVQELTQVQWPLKVCKKEHFGSVSC